MKLNRNPMNKTMGRRRLGYAIAATSAIPLLCAIARTAHATDDVYINPNGTLWSTTANWSDGFLPGTGDRAFVSALGITLNVDYANFPLLFLVLDAGNNAGNSTTLFQTIAADNMLSQNEWIGDSGTRPTTYLQLAATNTDTGDLSIAHSTNTAVGQYTLQGGTLTVLGSEYVGNAGAGTFNQTGGTHTIGTSSVSQNLFLGYSILSSGAFTLNGSAAHLSVDGSAYIGGSTTVSRGFGTLTIQSGNMTVSGTLKVWNGTGSVFLTGGILSLGSLDTSGNPSNFHWNGGTLTLASDLSISSTGPLGNSISIDSSKALFLQSSEIVGDISAGTLVQAGGANTVLSNLTVGNAINGTGAYTMNNAAATLTVKGVEYVGNSATGTIIGSTITQYGGAFNQSTGTHSVAGGLLLGFNPGASGSFTLGGGSLAVATTSGQFALNSEYIGYSGTGNVTQTGGTHTIGTPAGNQTLYVGFNAASLGSFTLNNNTAAATLTVNGDEIVGYNATGTRNGGTVSQYGGTFNQAAGNHTVTGGLFLAAGFGATGSFTLSGGSLATGTTNQGLNSEYVGDSGTGSFTQTGGTHTIGTPTIIQDLNIGFNTPGFGAYTLNSTTAPATLTVYGSEIIGFNATGTSSGGAITKYGGTFNQSAGNHTVARELILGSDDGSTGSFILSGGSLAVGTATGGSGLPEYIGESGTGSFIQSGGTHTLGTPAANQSLLIGTNGNTLGTYTMNNPAATLTVNGGEIVGFGGTGIFNQTAGTDTITGRLVLASVSVSTGSFSLAGGTLTVGTAGGAGNSLEYIGFSGNANFIQSGGTHTLGTPAANQFLMIGCNAASTGTYTMNNAAATFTVNGDAYLGGTNTAAGGVGLLNLSAGNATITGNLKVWPTAGMALNLTGGFLTLGSLDLSASPSTLNWTSGTLTLTGGGTGTTLFGNGLFIGSTTGSNAALNLQGGNLVVASVGTPATEFIGETGTGMLNQSGGNHTIGTPAANLNLNIGYYPSSIGTYNMSNAASTLTVNGTEIVGFGATGTSAGPIVTQYGGSFHQSAGSHTIGLNLFVAGDNGSTGSYAFSGGNLTIGAGGAEAVGLSGIGDFMQTGGTHTVGSPATPGSFLSVGYYPPAIGTYTMNSPAATLLVNGDEVVGDGATGISNASGNITTYGGSFNQIAGNHTVTSSLVVGFQSGSTGSFTLSGGSLTVVTPGVAGVTGHYECIGFSGVGTFIQSGGTNTIGSSTAFDYLFLGYTAGAIGTYTMNNPAATLNVNGIVFLGGNGSAAEGDGVLNLSAGNATIIGLLTIWNTPGTLVNLSGGTLHLTFVDNMQSFAQYSGNSLFVTGNFTNSGTASFAGTQNWSPTSSFTNTAGSASFQSNAKLYALTITGGTVDITSSKLVIEPANKSATLAALEANIANHSLIASGIPANFALALLDNALLNKTTFGGNPVDQNSLLLSEELLGDTNADGHVDLTDLSTLLNNFGSATSSWTSGNFDGQPAIDLTDLSDVLNNFGVTNPNANTKDLALSTKDFAPTPEPSSLYLLTTAFPALLRRMRSTKGSRRRALACP